jgi:pyruvate/2-oxoglutarate dehydrogenase complex dihydrolipoamide acyltransferase (E2) component
MSQEVIVPRLGLTMEVGILTQWLVQDGDRVEADQPIAEIATDKIEHELLAPVAGTIADLHATDDEEELPVGTVIARITP